MISTRTSVRVIVCTLAGFFALAAGAMAQDITFRFSGVVTDVDYYNPAFPDIAVGTPFSGTYTFSLAAPDTNTVPGVADYWHRSPAYGINVTIGHRVFQTDPENVQFLVAISNDHYSGFDNYSVRSYRNLPTEDVSVEHISWQLDDPTATALSSEALTAAPPTLDLWQQLTGLTITGGSADGTSSLFIRGRVTLIEPEGSSCTAQCPAGPMGPAGPQGEKGDKGEKGDPGEVPQGTLIFLLATDPAPVGYTYIGSFDQLFNADPNGGGGSRVNTIRIFRKN